MANKPTILFNRDSEGRAEDIPLGGLPLYNSDISNLQDLAVSLGTPSIYGADMVLSGCLVDELTTTNGSQVVKITAGKVVIKGIVYDVEAFEVNSYPFAIVPGPTTVESRAFRISDVFDVAEEFTISIRTNFTMPAQDGTLESTFPTDLPTDGYILFNPFTAQRIEHVTKASSTAKGTMSPIWADSIVTKTETGKDIVGTNKPNYMIGNSGQWKHLGWTNHSNSDEFILRNSGSGSPAPGGQNGSNTILLGLGNIPRHTHNKGSIQVTGAGSHIHRFKTGAQGANWNGTGQSGNAHGDLGYMDTSTGGVWPDGDHTHGIAGSTDDGANNASGVAQLKSTPDSFSVKGYSLYCNMMTFNGYNSSRGFYNFFSGITPYTNM